MKQKLFENVGGNQFKLITESVEEVNPNTKHVREGLKKVFGSGSKSLSYKRLRGVGIGYIKSVSEAQKIAIQEARILAKEYGYMDDENSQKFVKDEGKMYRGINVRRYDSAHNNPSDETEGDFENGSPAPVGSPGKVGTEENREVQIANTIINICDAFNGSDPNMAKYSIQRIKSQAQELIQMHG